jgi:oxygen-independent coproporphyrinogen III oxidase
MIPPPPAWPARPGLYIHVPFCASKCGYCDFHSLARPPNDPSIDRYLDTLTLEASRRPEGFEAGTIFIGGGTPTHLPAPDLARLLAIAREAAGGAVEEWTVEANPGTLTPGKLDTLRAAGVDRLSIGAQSFDPARLAALGRRHGPDDIRAAVRAARAAGIPRISLDLIYAQPGQTAAAAVADVRQALALDPEHLSLYALTVEEGTPLHERVATGEVTPPDGDEARRQYDRLCEELEAAGWPAYEISNFARPGAECLHNLLYWTGGDYLGLGPSAHSHLSGARRANLASLDAWGEAVSGGRPATALDERLPPDRKARETLICALRLCGGFETAAFRDRTGIDPDDLCGGDLAALEREGLIERRGSVLRLAPSARFISDAVFARLV